MQNASQTDDDCAVGGDAAVAMVDGDGVVATVRGSFVIADDGVAA